MPFAPFDVFRRDLLGTPVWIEAVSDFETARRRISELVEKAPGEYFVFSQKSQKVVSDTRPTFVAYVHP
jgi:hypothetical protein